MTPDPLLNADREREDAVERLRQALSLPVVRRYVAAQAFGHAAIAITAYLGEAAALSSPETTPAGVLPDEMRREIEALPEPLVWQDNVSRAAVLEIVDQRTPAGVLDEAALREALDRLVKAWDSGITTDAAKWRAADLEIDAALVQARAALGRSGSGGR